MPGFIILDLMLPKMPGLEVCKILKSNTETRWIPIMLLTAKAEENPLYLQRGSQHHLIGGTIESDGCAVAPICRSPTSWEMKMNTSPSSSGEIRSYVQLQHQIHDAPRKQQHPEWIEQDGGSPTCES
jgi:CheY-like chemotaxis protein